jgi:glycosyltransferase involved in cell wall biosynthesis
LTLTRQATLALDRLRVLCAIPSTNQMYSGVGRAIRELSRRMTDRVEITFAVDDLNARNVSLLGSFALEHGMTVLVGNHRADDRGVDPANEALPGLVASGHWDVIELVGFANAATGSAVLENLGAAALVYTPHDQPLWTVPMSAAQADHVGAVHRRVLDRADLVLADSPHERAALQALTPGRSHVRYLPLGCDFAAFGPGPVDREDRLLFVGDLNEIRKRFDRVAAVFARLLARRPGLRLAVVGNRSDEWAANLPAEIRPSVDLLGYVSETELRWLYATSRGLVLLSEVEAFGLPILEAMARGTPVFLADLETTRSLFGPFASAHFCPADDLVATASLIDSVLGLGDESIHEAIAERDRLRETFDWTHLALAKATEIAAAWSRRAGWKWVA